MVSADVLTVKFPMTAKLHRAALLARCTTAGCRALAFIIHLFTFFWQHVLRAAKICITLSLGGSFQRLYCVACSMLCDVFLDASNQ